MLFVEMWVIIVGLVCALVESTVGVSVPTNPSIIIVGSGPSGIAAATKLLKNNFTNIKILEAENRIGGRIHSIKFGDAYVDLGAEFCHGEEGNVVYSMAKDLDILAYSNRSTNYYFQSNGDEIDGNIGNKIYNFVEELGGYNKTIDECENATSFGECLDIRIKSFIATGQNEKEKEILTSGSDWVNSALCSYMGTFDLHDLRMEDEYVTCDGDLFLTWNGLGYKTILEIMMQKYPNNENQLPIDDKIFLNKEVNNTSNWQNRNRMVVTATDGSTYEADHIIFTPSLGVLKAKYNELFNPPLPQEKIDSIKNIGFDAIVKIILHFQDKWWAGEEAFNFFWTSGDKEEIKKKHFEWLIDISGFSPGENNPNVFTAWFAGKHVPLIESLSEEHIFEGIKYVINKFLAPCYNVTMPDKLIRTTWYTNPHFRGTYSYNSVKGGSTGGKSFHETLGSPLKNIDGTPTILFAGEATHPQFYSTVHGAIESGYREADRLIKLYQNSL